MTLIDNVREWLEGQGFPLEMRAAAAFRAAGFEVRQASHYLDPENGTSREIDVLATDPDFLGIVGIHFAIECKSSKKPWVLLTSPHTLSGYNRLFAFGVLSEKALHAFAERFRDFIGTVPWLRKDGPAGYSFRQALGERADIAFSAAVSVAKACEYLIRPTDKQYAAPLGFAFPVIVVDTPLIACSLDDDSGLRLTEIEQGEFLFFARLPRQFGSCIRVVTARALSGFALEAKQTAERLRAALKPEEDSVVASWHSDDRKADEGSHG